MTEHKVSPFSYQTYSVGCHHSRPSLVNYHEIFPIMAKLIATFKAILTRIIFAAHGAIGKDFKCFKKF